MQKVMVSYGYIITHCLVNIAINIQVKMLEGDFFHLITLKRFRSISLIDLKFCIRNVIGICLVKKKFISLNNWCQCRKFCVSWVGNLCYRILYKSQMILLLTPFWPMFPFYTPWKHWKTKSLLVFSGGIKWEHWPELS